MIRPTFLAFETAKQALNVSQAGLDTVGHNISNANTLGYTRQRVDQVSISLNGLSAQYQVFGTPTNGLGATIQGINQIRDPFLDNRYRAEATVNGELGIKGDGLTDINNIFDEIMTDGLHSKLSDLINALDKFSLAADTKELAMVVRNTANELVQMLNKNAQQLEDARIQQKADLQATIDSDINTIIESIAGLNKQIKEENFYGNPANELNDTRNMLIDKLSEYADIKVVRTPIEISSSLTIEELSIEINNTGDPKNDVPNVKLVDGGQYNKFVVSDDLVKNDGSVIIKVADGISGFEVDIDLDRSNGVSGDITSKLYSGGLKGYIDIINGVGPNASAGVSTYRGIPYYQTSLDEFAQKLAEIFNRVNNISQQESEASGSDPSKALLPPTTDKNLFVPQSLTLEGSPAWINQIIPNGRQFSGGSYDMTFTYTSGTNTITATLPDGKSYTGEYAPDGTIDFVGDDNAIAFSIKTTDAIPDAVSGVTIDANITAKNIAISSSWFDDPMYITTTKMNAINEVKPELTLMGSANPLWLKSIEIVDDTVNFKNGSYVFDISTTTPKQISVNIGGTTYTGEYVQDGTVELSANGTVGLRLVTSSKALGTTDKENTATINVVTGANSDNLNKLKIAIKEENGYSSCGFYGNFQEFLVNFQGEMAIDQQYNTTMLNASTTVIASLADRRDSISAVSVDEEGINMMTYQNYYNAAARYMTTLDEALDKIINGMGTVGR